MSCLKKFPILRPTSNDLYIQCVTGKNDLCRNRLIQITLDEEKLSLGYKKVTNFNVNSRKKVCLIVP